jgi:RNA polymerase sigma-B factor
MAILPDGEKMSPEDFPSQAETLAKFRAYRQTSDSGLRDDLVMQHALLVEKLARRYATYGEPVEDLIQEGYIGLIKAVDQFDPDKAVKFTTYATHIIAGEIRHYLRDLGTLIKEPAWLQELRYRVNRARDGLTQKLGRPPSIDEIASSMNLDLAEVAGVLKAGNVFYVESLDEGGEDGDRDRLGTLDPERISGGRPARRDAAVEDRVVLRQFIARLKDLERKAIVEFFYEERSKTEIARRQGISVNYVSYLVKRGLKHLAEMLAQAEQNEALLRVQTMEEKLSVSALETGEYTATDPATGFLTRRQFERRLRDEIARAKRYPQTFGIVFLKLDQRAPMKERWGKVLTTPVLERIADGMRSAVRQIDDLCRLGANEFAVILPNTGQDGAAVAERVRSALESAVPTRRADEPSPFGIECRLVVFPDDGGSARELMERSKTTGPKDA